MVAVDSAVGIVWSPGTASYSDVDVRLRGSVNDMNPRKVEAITTRHKVMCQIWGSKRWMGRLICRNSSK